MTELDMTTEPPPGGLTETSPGQTDRVMTIAARANAAAKPVETAETPGGLTADSPGQTERVRAARDNAEAKVITAIDELSADTTTETVKLISDPHPYQVMPALTAEEADQLRESIRESGVLLPIVVDELGVIIEGHNRAKMADELGVQCPRTVRTGMTEVEKRTFAYTANTARRQLTREQKQKLLAQSIKSDPQLSDREHARRLSASPSTVGTVRGQLEAEGAVSKLDTRVGGDGVQQPATKPAAGKGGNTLPPEVIDFERAAQRGQQNPEAPDVDPPREPTYSTPAAAKAKVGDSTLPMSKREIGKRKTRMRRSIDGFAIETQSLAQAVDPEIENPLDPRDVDPQQQKLIAQMRADLKTFDQFLKKAQEHA